MADSGDPNARPPVTSMLRSLPQGNCTALSGSPIIASWSALCIHPYEVESAWAQKTAVISGGSLLDFEASPEEANVPAPWGLLALRSQAQPNTSCARGDKRARAEHRSFVSMRCKCGCTSGVGAAFCQMCGRKLDENGIEDAVRGPEPLASNLVSSPWPKTVELDCDKRMTQRGDGDDGSWVPHKSHAAFVHSVALPGLGHPSDLAIAAGVKTLLVQCIPPDFDQRRLLELWRYREYCLTMLWLPYLVKQRRHMGHAFLEFATPEAALRFWRLWEHYTMSPNSQPLAISAASSKTVEESIETFFGRELTGVLKSRRFQPAIFCPQGRLVFKPGVPPADLPLLSGAPRLPS